MFWRWDICSGTLDCFLSDISLEYALDFMFGAWCSFSSLYVKDWLDTDMLSICSYTRQLTYIEVYLLESVGLELEQLRGLLQVRLHQLPHHHHPSEVHLHLQLPDLYVYLIFHFPVHRRSVEVRKHHRDVQLCLRRLKAYLN